MVTESYNISIPAGTSMTFTGAGISNRTNHSNEPVQTFIVAPADSAGGDPGAMIFTGISQASRAMIINNGATVSGAAGGTTTFQDSSLGYTATVIANGGTNGGEGGLIQFLNHSLAKTAEIEVYGNGTLLVDTASPGIIGGFSGDGLVVLNNSLITFGAGYPFNYNPTFSGEISGSGGLVIKYNAALAGASTYAGSTQVVQGVFTVTNTTGSATGSGDVLVQGDELAGNGIIEGNVTVSAPPNNYAFPHLAPGTADIGTLTLLNSLTLGHAIYVCRVNGNTGQSDLVKADSVTIDRKVTLHLTATGTAPIGTVFTIVETTGDSPISGTFANLPDGGTIVASHNTFQANYEGGDGNDLTLTVIN
jgi:autotransporter-associated beta strand protein